MFNLKSIIKTVCVGAGLVMLLSGCSYKECNIGSAYSGQHDKCIVTNVDLKAVVESVVCLEGKCKAVIVDERNRTFSVETDQEVKVGDSISLVLFTDPLVNSEQPRHE